MKRIAVVALLAALVAAFVVPTAFAAGWSYSNRYCYPAGYVVGISVSTSEDRKGPHMWGNIELGDWDYYNNNGYAVTDTFGVSEKEIGLLSQLQTAATNGYWVFVTTDTREDGDCKKYDYRGKATGVSFYEPRSYDYDDGYGKE